MKHLNKKYEVFFSVNFDSDKETKIVYSSLIPEIDRHHFERSEVSIKIRAKKLVINITAQDVNSAKASINSILQWISTITETLGVVAKHIFNS
jgi:tRNA threonylcarbamoyladenosine modification (KEOPS) complex  Pcc1 subunit